MMPFTAAKLGAVQGSVIVVGGGREPGQRGWGLRLVPSPPGNEADVQWLRGDDHARDMAFDQLAVRGSGAAPSPLL